MEPECGNMKKYKRYEKYEDIEKYVKYEKYTCMNGHIFLDNCIKVEAEI